MANLDVRYEELQTANVPTVRVAQKVHVLLTGRKSASENVVLRGTLKLLAEKKAEVILLKRLEVDELHVTTSTTRGFEDLEFAGRSLTISSVKPTDRISEID